MIYRAFAERNFCRRIRTKGKRYSKVVRPLVSCHHLPANSLLIRLAFSRVLVKIANRCATISSRGFCPSGILSVPSVCSSAESSFIHRGNLKNPTPSILVAPLPCLPVNYPRLHISTTVNSDEQSREMRYIRKNTPLVNVAHNGSNLLGATARK